MKRLFSAIFGLFFAVLAQAGPLDPSDIRVTQNNANVPSNGIVTRYLSFTGGDCVIWLNNSTSLPDCLKIGANLSISSGFLTAAAGQADWNASSGSSQILNKPTFATVAFTGAYSNLTGQPTLGTASALNVPSSGDASAGQVVLGSDSRMTDDRTPTAHNQAWSTITSTPTTLAGYGIADAYPLSGNPSAFLTAITGGMVTTALGLTPVDQAGARSAISLTTTGSGAASYSSSTGVLNVPTPSAPSQASASRSLNSAFQVSATRLSHVKYAVQQTITASIAGGQNGDIILEIASDSGFTANVQTIDINGFGQTYTLAIALQGIQPQTTSVSGWVPAAYYVRIRSVNNTGTPGFLYRAGQELLY